MAYLKNHLNWRRRACLLSILKNMVLLAATAILFYGNIWVTVFGLPFLIFLVKKDIKKAEKKREKRMLSGFCEALQAMKTALRVGYAIENAVTQALRDLHSVYGNEEPIVMEFERMQNELRMRIPAEDVFDSFAGRNEIEDIRAFSIIFRTARRTGGNLIAVMNNTVDTIEEKNRVHMEIDAVLSAKKLEWRIMTVVPFGIVLYLRACFPQFLASLYGNLAGVIVMSLVLLCIAGAFAMGNKILQIEV